MIGKLIPLFLITLKTSRCSLIIDNSYQKGVYLSDYCPNMKFCREGSHVMCMFYDPNKVIGPRCYNAVNISITADLANQLLDVSNTIRSKIALGKETGKGGELLPRGYGIFRLKWDNELATFAQVLANQCVLRHDMCRATMRFPNPSQTAGLVRFTYPDWQPMSSVKGISSTPGVTNAKLVYAITQSLKSWYAHKSSVTEHMVKVYPDWSSTPTNQLGRLYLDMIHGPATHMGCGMSGYSEYVYYENRRQGIHNSIQVICNFSAGARKGTNSYETDPPIPDQGFSRKCGCPPGSQEDNECLCIEGKPPSPRAKLEPPCPVGAHSENNCDPTLVLLPIFTMEDAPPDKLYQIADDIKDPLKNFILQRIDNKSDAIERQGRIKTGVHVPSSIEMFDLIHESNGKNALQKHTNKPVSAQSPAPSFNEEPQASPIYRFGPDPKPPPPPPRHSPTHRPSPPVSFVPRSRLPPLPPPRIPPPPPPPAIEEYTAPVKAREERRPAATHERSSRPLPKLPPKRQKVTKKSSIFAKVAQFQLPKRRSMSSSLKVIKKDVAPRKDFTNLHKVVNDYLKRRPGYKIIRDSHEEYKPNEVTKQHVEEKSQTEAVVTDTGLDNAEETVINFNQYLKQKNDSNYNDKDVEIKDDNDNKLLSLLDTLEREVKNIALDGNEKELFDAKIRKIYGSIVGKTALQKFPKPILLSTADVEAPEIDFGGEKINDKLELDHEEDNHIKVTQEPRQRKRNKVDKRIGRIKSYNPSIQGHKWMNKFIDTFDQKKYHDNIMDVISNGDRKPSDTYDHKHNDNFDHPYGDIDHKHVDDLDRKYNENVDKKYSDNHFDHENNGIQHKLNDNFDHRHRYELDRKYDDNELNSRNKIKHDGNRGVFREFEHNSLSSQEDKTSRNYRYKDTKANHEAPDIPFITKDREKRKKSESKHRNRVKSLNSRLNDPLGLERRKYYQEKLDSIRRKLRARNSRKNDDSRNDRSQRRMHTKNRESPRTRSKSQADNFYMPERARFLHGF